MRYAAQKIRIAAVIIGCCKIITGIIFECSSFVYVLVQNQEYGMMAISNLIAGLLNAFYPSTLLVLVALIMNPEKVAPLLCKRESASESVNNETGKDIENLRIAGVVIGYCIIIGGIVSNCIIFVQVLSQNGPVLAMLYLISGVPGSFSSGALVILVALIINPEKVPPIKILKIFSGFSLKDFLIKMPGKVQAFFTDSGYNLEVDYGEDDEDDEEAEEN